MTYSPDSEEKLYSDLRDRLVGKVEKLTNFTQRSFNGIFFSAISRYFREVELRLLASQLSGYIEYAGGPVTEDDLNQLGIDNVSPEEINPYLYDQQLERLVDVVGISRNEGDRATGFIDITTTVNSPVSIPQGTVVTTSPDSSGETLEFRTVEEENAPVGQDVIFDIEVESVERGEEYNIPADSITRFAEPPIGVRGIEDSTGMSGGEGVESNDSLRSRARNAVSEQPTGGTANGIVGYISNQVENVDPENIGITEVYSDNIVEVTVDGGGDDEVELAIEDGRPLGVEHTLIRPQTIEISIKGKLLGTDIDISFVSTQIENYLLNDLNVSDDLYQDKIIRNIVNTTSNIINVSQLTLTVTGVTNERKQYEDGVDKYRLDYTFDGDSSRIFDQYGNTYNEEDGDYTIIDETGDDLLDTIKWETGPAGEVETGDDFFVNYSSSQDTDFVPDEKHFFDASKRDVIKMQSDSDEYKLSAVPDEATILIEDPDTEDGTADYTLDTDYTIENTEGPKEETQFVFTSGRDEYELNESVFADSVIVEDETGAQYYQVGSGESDDYELLDNDGDGIVETINWDTGAGSTPGDDQLWTVEYRENNGIPQTIVWQDSSTNEPAAGDDFVVKYSQSVYQFDNEINVIDDTIISCSCPGSDYVYETDFEFVDYNANGQEDSIRWISEADRPGDGVPFYTTYRTDGDVSIDEQQKIDAGNITLTEQ